MTKYLLLTTACAFLVTGLAHAAEAPAPDVAGADGANALEGVVVTATRSAQSIDKVGQSITVLDARTLKSQQTVVVTDLLAQTPGVTVTRNGGPGENTTLRIRGAETDQTVVVVDGVKLNDPTQPGGGYNFGNLLAGDISRIEVLRGSQSTLWGSQAIGGVINIVTAEPTKPLEGSAQAEAGTQGTSYVRAGVGGATDRLTWRLAASHYSTDGVSAYRFGTEKDGYHNTGLSGRANVKLADDVSLDLRAVYSAGRNKFDGFPFPLFVFADDSEYGTTKDLVTYAGLNFALLDGRLRNRAAFGYTRTDRDNYDPTQAVTTKTFDAVGQNKRYEYQGVFDITDSWLATFGAEREDATMVSKITPQSPLPIDADAIINSVYGQLQATLAQGLTLTGGLRYDHHSTFGGHTLGQVAAAWALNDGTTILRASFGQGFKAPTLYQLFSEYGNQALKPEKANSWDAGVEQKLLDGKAQVRATYFDRKSRNQIAFVSCFSGPAPLCATHPSGGYYDNIARSKAHGIELEGVANVGVVKLTANYTWTVDKNDAAGTSAFGKFLPRQPKNEANLWADWTWLGRLSSGIGVRYVGADFDNATNTVRIKSYALIDLRASYPINDTFEVYGRIENVADRNYQTIANYGTLGRVAMAGVRAKF